MHWLQNEPQHWLIILDNADDIEIDYSQYMVSGHYGAVLMTTRNPKCIRYGTAGNEVFDGIGFDDALTLLLRTCEMEEKVWSQHYLAARNVVLVLNQHPLAIAQAGAYIEKGFCSIEEYTKVFEQKRKELCENHIDQGKSEYGGVYSTFEVSASSLGRSPNEESKNALKLLDILAYMYREGVSEYLFEAGWKGFIENLFRVTNEHQRRPSLMYPTKWHADQIPAFIMNLPEGPELMERAMQLGPGFTPLRKARDILRSYSLINVSQNGTISMHPLAHSWARERLNSKAQEAAWASASSIIAFATHKNYYPFALVHIEFCFRNKPERWFTIYPPFQICIIFFTFAYRLLITSDFEGCLRITKLLQEKIESIPEIGTGSMNWIQIQNMAAVCHHRLGNTHDGKKIMKKIIDFRSEANLQFSLEDSFSMISTFVDLGRYQEAKNTLRGLPNMDTSNKVSVLFLDWLGFFYEEDGRFDRALRFYKKNLKSLKLREKPGSENLCYSRFFVGRIYYKQGQYRKALPIMKNVIRQRKKMTKYINWHTLDAMYYLAASYMKLTNPRRAIYVLEDLMSLVKVTDLLADWPYLEFLPRVKKLLVRAYSELEQLEKASSGHDSPPRGSNQEDDAEAYEPSDDDSIISEVSSFSPSDLEDITDDEEDKEIPLAGYLAWSIVFERDVLIFLSLVMIWHLSFWGMLAMGIWWIWYMWRCRLGKAKGKEVVGWST